MALRTSIKTTLRSLTSATRQRLVYGHGVRLQHSAAAIDREANVRLHLNERNKGLSAQQDVEAAGLGFIGGAGKMASAILNGFIDNDAIEADSVYVADANKKDLVPHKEKGINVTENNVDLCKACDRIVLAVKPHLLKKVIFECGPELENKLVVSIAAGVTTKTIEQWVIEACARAGVGTVEPRVVRLMPNTPCLIGESAASICGGLYASKKDVDYVREMFQHLGVVEDIDETLMDAATALAGSGPAFVSIFMEALADGGVAAGLPRPIAQTFAVQVVRGTAALAEHTELHPGQLKDQVCSPAGTTIAGVTALERNGFRAAVIDAVMSARKRSEELSKS